jgi:hypothetical protein
LILFLAFSILRKRFRNGLFFDTVTGYHFIVFIFIGCASFLYIYIDNDINERIGQQEVLDQFSLLFPSFTFGYFIVFLSDYFSWVSNSKKISFKQNISGFDTINSVYILILLFSKFIIEIVDATSGVNTIFVVFSRFLFPVIIIVFYSFNFKRPLSVLNLLILFIFIIIDLIFSKWRSDFIFVILSISISFLLKSNFDSKKSFKIFLSSLIFISVILPFQFLKKNTDVSDKTELFSSIKGSVFDQFYLGISLFPSFIINRLNYIREMAYVNFAVIRNKIQLLDGESYSNLFLQLIPRIFWDNKPKFNEFYGRLIPRQIGLVSESDLNTSWAVNPFAEFLYNFSHEYLWIFVVLYFLFLRFLDRISYSFNFDLRIKFYLILSLFFLSINLVSLSFTSTYLLWLFITVAILNKIFKNTSSI